MWTKGERNGYTYWVKHYSEPSAEFGLNGSRISKLEIRLGNTVTCSYDRGLQIEPRDKGTAEVLDYIYTIFG